MRGYGSIFVLLTSTILFGVASPAKPQVVVSDSGVGYIDSAIPGDLLRLRFDAAYGNDFPNRAEFFWPAAVSGSPERNVDYQDIAAYLEFAPAGRFSVFAEFPVRFLNPDINDNTAGFADMNTGFKYALVQDDCSVASCQLRVYIPTGDGDRRIGADHVSLEPALLLYRRLSERITFEAELRDWIPIDGTEGFAGNVLRYGAGLSYLAHACGHFTVRPVAEFVGWTVLDGRKSNVTGSFDADGDTIVNAKLGLRLQLGNGCPDNSLYFGYGRALTGDVWYEDIVRVEYRLCF